MRCPYRGDGAVLVEFQYNKRLWFVSELPEKISETWWSSVGSIRQ